MYTPIWIGFNLQYGPYAHFGYWTLISDPKPNKIVENLKSNAPKVPNQGKAKRNGVINITYKTIISVNYKTENFNAIKTLRINCSRTWFLILI